MTVGIKRLYLLTHFYCLSFHEVIRHEIFKLFCFFFSPQNINMEAQLRTQCKNLLDQLKYSQKSLTQQSLSTDIFSNEKDADALPDNIQMTSSDHASDFRMKALYARDKLSSFSKFNSGRDKDNVKVIRKGIPKDAFERNMNKGSKNAQDLHCLRNDVTIQKELRTSSHVEDQNNNNNSVNIKDSFLTHSKEKRDGTQPTSRYPVTPNTLRKRQLIDRHTSVPTTLNADELKELNNERLLNFDYCHISVDDDVTKLNGDIKYDEVDKENLRAKEGKVLELASSTSYVKFKEQLQDDGNNRNFSNWVRETTMKPKTILNSTDYYSLNPSKKVYYNVFN